MAHLNLEETKAEKEKRYGKMKKRISKMDCCQATLRVPIDIYKKFKKKLVDNRKSMNEFFIDKITKYIED